jgi:hypothetical protein
MALDKLPNRSFVMDKSAKASRFLGSTLYNFSASVSPSSNPASINFDAANNL